MSREDRREEINEEALTAAHKAVEDALIDFRDSRISTFAAIMSRGAAVSEDLIDEMITFVRLQLDEDEQKALAIDAKEWAEDSSWFKDMLDPLPSQRRERPGWLPMITVEDVRHIARHDPARVLRDVKAFRKIIDYCASAIEVGRIPEGATWSDDAAGAEVGEVVLRHLAAIFSDRPGYREEWRP